jgi:histidine triad (HIT) family protein
VVPGPSVGIGGHGHVTLLGERRPSRHVPRPPASHCEQAASGGGRGHCVGKSLLGSGRRAREHGLGRGGAKGDFSHIETKRNLEPTAECIFDQIINGDVPAHVVFQDGAFIAFLDFRPVFDGHTLVVPRVHYANLAETPEHLLGPMLGLGRRVAAAQKTALGAHGAFFALNETVSQSVPHVHLHVVPRRAGDGLRGFLWPRHVYESEGVAAELAARLSAALG